MNSKNPEMQQHHFLKFVGFFFNSTQQTQHFVLSPKSSALTEGTNQCLVCLTKGSINTSLCTWIFKCTSLFISFQSHSSPALGTKHNELGAQRDQGEPWGDEIITSSPKTQHPLGAIPAQQSLNSSGGRRKDPPGLPIPPALNRTTFGVREESLEAECLAEWISLV